MTRWIWWSRCSGCWPTPPGCRCCGRWWAGRCRSTTWPSHVGKPAPSVSQHLAKLRMARLVRTRREGTTIFYRLENDHVGQLVTDAVFNAEHAGPGVPGHHRDAADLPLCTPRPLPTDRGPTKGRRA